MSSGRTSAKEKCFEEAATAYELASGSKLYITYQQAWIRDGDGVWSRGTRIWWALVNSLRKTRNWENGEADAPGTVRELRRPDLTINMSAGHDLVVDLKFTRANGTIDGWRPGQQAAYAEINRQQGTAPGAVALDPVSCGCKDRKQEREAVRVPDSQLRYFMSPFSRFGRVPSARGLRIPGIRIFPEPTPIPELVPVLP